MKEKTLLPIIMALLIVFPLVSADIIIPTVTKVYFEKDGQPYDKPISFTVNCYGYSQSLGSGVQKESGAYTPEKVFSFSADIQKYGEEIFEDYYMNYRHIDYCNIEGETSGERFFIEKYLTSPINFSKCKRGQFNEKDDKGYDIERSCELRVDISQNISSTPEPQGFWIKIGCFFKRLFSGSC